GSDVQFWALGPWVSTAGELASVLALETGLSIGVVNARFAKPIDEELLAAQAAQARLIVTFEDHVVSGGFGSAVLEALAARDLAVPTMRIGYPDDFVEHGSDVEDVRALVGLDRPTLERRLRERLAALLPADAPTGSSR
ncbi:MAG: transketolase C-terminal domain-containing protein, partial [Verrucomicrobiota bacterium]